MLLCNFKYCENRKDVRAVNRLISDGFQNENKTTVLLRTSFTGFGAVRDFVRRSR